MKIAINFTLEIDAEAWSLEYGIPPFEVRDDVKGHIENMAREFVRELGLGGDA